MDESKQMSDLYHNVQVSDRDEEEEDVEADAEST